MNTRTILIGAFVVLIFGIGIYFLSHGLKAKNTNDDVVNKKSKKMEVAQVPVISEGTPAGWVTVTVTNQPTISKHPQEVMLPEGWTAREDYLLTVVPPTLPNAIKNYRSIIMRPPKYKTMGREDAIYTVADASDPFFKDHCKPNDTLFLCYSGANTDTKAVFDMLQ